MDAELGTISEQAALPKEVERFDLHFRIQHVIMLTSFLLLFFYGLGTQIF
jgi:cytochrome b subunit of formate dehydrogenase